MVTLGYNAEQRNSIFDARDRQIAAGVTIARAQAAAIRSLQKRASIQYRKTLRATPSASNPCASIWSPKSAPQFSL